MLFAPITDQISPDQATVEVSNASVHLNDEIKIPDPENGTVAKCIASGTPGDHLTVRADVIVETPLEDGDDATYDVKVSIVDDTKTTTEPVRRTGREQGERLLARPRRRGAFSRRNSRHPRSPS